MLSQTLPAAADTEVLSPQRHEGLAVLLHGLLARSPSFLVCHGVTIFPLSPNKDAPHRPNTVEVFFPSDPGSCLLCHRHKCPPSLASVAGRWAAEGGGFGLGWQPAVAPQQGPADCASHPQPTSPTLTRLPKRR